jgi:hypothetical protein
MWPSRWNRAFDGLVGLAAHLGCRGFGPPCIPLHVQEKRVMMRSSEGRLASQKENVTGWCATG